jgi:flagellar FliJ protein
MKKFKFRLQKVADIKAKQEKQKSLELANLFLQLEKEKQQLQNLNFELDHVQQEIFRRTLEGCAAKEILEYQRYAEKLGQDIRTQKNKIQSLEEKIEKVQMALLKLNKEKKILERIREKRYLQYLQDLAREEQKMLDEMYQLTQAFKKRL